MNHIRPLALALLASTAVVASANAGSDGFEGITSTTTSKPTKLLTGKPVPVNPGALRAFASCRPASSKPKRLRARKARLSIKRGSDGRAHSRKIRCNGDTYEIGLQAQSQGDGVGDSAQARIAAVNRTFLKGTVGVESNNP